MDNLKSYEELKQLDRTHTALQKLIANRNKELGKLKIEKLTLQQQLEDVKEDHKYYQNQYIKITKKINETLHMQNKAALVKLNINYKINKTDEMIRISTESWNKILETVPKNTEENISRQSFVNEKIELKQIINLNNSKLEKLLSRVKNLNSTTSP